MATTDELDAARKAWSRTLEELQLQMGRAAFESWLRGTEVVDAGEGRLTVAVRHRYAQEWIQGRLLPVIQRTVDWVVGPETTLEFVVGSAEPGAGSPGATPTRAGPAREALTGPQTGDHGLAWSDFYIKFKVAFRVKALRVLKGAKLAVFLCLALHVDRDGGANPGIEAIMRQTGYSRGAVCSALGELETLGLVAKSACRWGPDHYKIQAYAWFGSQPAPSLWEEVYDDSPVSELRTSGSSETGL